LLFAINEKEHNVELTEEGQRQLSRNEPDLFLLPDLDGEFVQIDQNESLSDYEKTKQKQDVTKVYDERHEKIHNVHQLIRAYTLFKKDIDYVINEGAVIIVDEFTGRMMPGRRFSDGLHEALEAKEGVQVAKASQTIASITLQNYFRLYRKLAGMTGTAETEAAEFLDIYKLDVVVIPTNEEMMRQDNADVIYKTEKAKFRAVVNEIVECYISGQPTLVGTVSIKVSEQLSDMLKKDLREVLPSERFERLRVVNEEREQKNKNTIPHSVLNAKYHEKEAEIVAQAGQFGMVTIATNMAGRGTDIVLGAGVKELGGLHIIGTERHESRRIDNQLRGRSGRQGDPGSSRFYLSLEDDLMRIFGSERIASIMGRLGMEEDEPIEHGLISRTIQNAQKRVEAVNFEIRKNLLKYDDVNNKQREVIYTRRDHVIFSETLEQDFMYMMEDIIAELVAQHAQSQYPEEWDLEGLKAEFLERCAAYCSFDGVERESLTLDLLTERLTHSAKQTFAQKKQELEHIPLDVFQYFFGAVREGDTKTNVFLRSAMLRAIDRNWMDNLLALDGVKEGVHFQGYAQKDPLIEYKREAYEVFADMIDRINRESVEAVMKVSIRPRQESQANLIASASEQTADTQGMAFKMRQQAQQQAQRQRSVEDLATNTSESDLKARPVVREAPKVGRNDPCPCGSGKKYKKCHGQ
jgi:preprotein translocase subunit SecA